MKLQLLLFILKLAAAQQLSALGKYTTLGSACTQASCVAQGHFPCSNNYFYVNYNYVMTNTSVCGYDFLGNLLPAPDSTLKVYNPNAISATLTLLGYIDLNYFQTMPFVSTVHAYSSQNYDVFDFVSIYTSLLPCTSNCNAAPYGYLANDWSYFKLDYTVTIPGNTFYLAIQTGGVADTKSWLNISYSWTFNCTPYSPGLFLEGCGGSSPGTCSTCNNKA